MWRDAGVGLLLALATLMIACAEDLYFEKKSLNISVPRWVKNGTDDQVVLDCEYEYTLDEKNFVIKWYLDDDPFAIYQWIPSQNSRIFSSKFRPYADWEYQLEGSDKFTKYRRIVLKNPTIELRGTYQCTVNSVSGYGSAEAKMDIYAPAKNITLTYNTLPDNKVNVTCIVEKIFPEPEIQLFAISDDSDVPKSIGKTFLFMKDHGIHGYDITVNAVVSTYQLNSSSDTTFRCVVLIHESDYQEEKEKIYHPSTEMAKLEPLYENHNKSSSSTSLIPAPFICIILAILVL